MIWTGTKQQTDEDSRILQSYTFSICEEVPTLQSIMVQQAFQETSVSGAQFCSKYACTFLHKRSKSTEH
jgi:hypothetical protein